MNKPDFDELLAGYRRITIPELPSSFRSNVLREIRMRRPDASADWVSMLFACLRPGMVAASLSVALVVGILAPGLARANDNPPAAEALGLSVFSSSSSNFPSSLHR